MELKPLLPKQEELALTLRAIESTCKLPEGKNKERLLEGLARTLWFIVCPPLVVETDLRPEDVVASLKPGAINLRQ